MTCGIYQIKCITSNKIYIGSAVLIKRRWSDHKRLLARGIHYNKFLQSEWNKYGVEHFTFSILEETSRNERMSCEQKWLDQCFDNQKYCYNMQPFAGTCRGRIVSDETRKKISAANLGKSNTAAIKTFNVKLLSPDGKIYGPITNLEAFSKTHNLNSSSLWKIIKGFLKTCKGWRLLETPNDSILRKQKGQKISAAKFGTKRPDVFNRCAKEYKIWLVDPNGIEHFLDKGLAKFARENNLSTAKLSLLLLKKRKTHKGWKIK